MNKKTLAVIAAILVLCSLIFCGCEININLPETPSENSSGSDSENSDDASSESESSQSGVVSPGKRPFNPETSEPVHENNEAPDSYEKLINEMYYNEYVFGEAFIGYVEGPMGTGYEEFFEERGYLDEYPFIAEIPYERYIETDGNEMYCIVPRDKNSSVSVNEWKSSPTGGTYGKVLYRSESGEPFIITCNEDGANPNVKIVIVDSDGNVFEFSPYFNSQLGWLEVYETPEARAHDFTVYENSSDNDILVFEDLLGDWAGFYTTPEGDEVQFHFNFYRAAYGEPCVTFWYGEDYGVYKEYYEGYAYEQYDENGDFTGSLILEMTLTQGTNSAEKGQILLMSTYEFRRAEWDKNWIVVSCTGGGNLLEEYGLGWFEMAQTMG
ncbi:MAG: hypothetical protein IJ945_04310 [Oscillospiraceae bacterium]|nr:hypothetical protein [Oscillospiraceae bacterium]